MRILPLVVAALTLPLVACGSNASSDAGSGELAGQVIEVAGVWSGDEQKAFEAVLEGFEVRTGADVNYVSAGDDLPTVLQTKVDGKTPPNVAILAQPGLIAQFAKSGALKRLDASVQQALDTNYAPIWKQLGSVSGNPYGVYFKVANKSVVWYRDKVFQESGFQTPSTMDEYIKIAKALSDNGTAPMSVGGADGWVLTDWFENIYLQTAGPEMYDKLSRHEIPWTDPSVTKALSIMRDVLQDELVAGGRQGVLQTDFATSISDVFGDTPKAAMVYEGDFVGGVITAGTKSVPGKDAKIFPFPSIGSSGRAVVAGGDAAVAFKDDPATMALLKYLASPEAAEVWAAKGGFLSPSKSLTTDSYPDELTRTMATQLREAGDKVRFDMSDLAPAAFGATKGAGSWKDLQDFLADPADLDAVARKLEADAAKAFAP